MSAGGREAALPVVGVDGGGSGCRAVVLTADGRVAARAEGEAAVARAADPLPAARAVVAAATRALAAAGGGRAGALWAALAGAGSEEARRAVEEALRAAEVANVVGVGTDADAAFHAVFRDGPGILLVAGTGSIAVARGPDGRRERCGGWGPRTGDEGSAYWIGVRALRQAARQADGRAEPGRLPEVLRRHLGLASAEDLRAWVASASRPAIAALAPHVIRFADEGDAAAGAVVAEAVKHLCAHVRALKRTLRWASAEVPVALAGGLLLRGRPLRPRVEEALAREGCVVVGGDPDAALGAAWLAADLPARGAGGR